MPPARPQTVHFVLFGSIASLLALSTQADAADDFWTGAVSNDWNTAGNWSLGTVPGTGDNAHVDISGGTSAPFRATISANVSTVVDILVSRGGLNAQSPGILNHTAGTASTGTNNWLDVGTDGGSGIYNLANTNTTGGTLTGFGTGSGSVSAYRMYVGGVDFGGGGGTGTFNMNTSGTLNTTNDFLVGIRAGTGVFNLDAGTINAGTGGGWAFVGSEKGAAGSKGTFNMSGGTFNNTFAGNRFIIGEGNATGTVNITGGALNNDGELWVGQATGGNGTFSVSSGTVQVNSWFAVGRQGATGTVNLSGGSITKGGGTGSHFIVGSLSGNGTVNQTGGSVNTVGNGDVRLGEGTSTALWDLSGGTVAADAVRVGWNGGTNEFKIRGTGALTTPLLSIGENGSGVVNESGGSLTVSGDVNVQAGTGTGTFNLSGGILSVDGVINRGAGSFTFTGGKLSRSNAGIITFNGNLTTGAGAATFDLDNIKTFDINGAFDDTAGVTLELTGIAIPAWDGSGVDTGSFVLGTVDSIVGTFNPTKDTITNLTINNPFTTTFISEAAGEGGTFNPNSQSVYWVQESGGVVSLQYSVVPEPGSAALLALGAVAAGLRRRRS